MAVIKYTAKRRVDASRVAGVEYSFEAPLAAFNAHTKRNQSTATSLSGKSTTLLHSLKRSYEVSTVPVNGTALIAQIREFLDSVAGGEEFEIDVYGSMLAPASPLLLKLDGDYSESLIDLTGFYVFDFKVK